MNLSKVIQVNGNMITVETDIAIKMNEIGYIQINSIENDMTTKLKAEVIRVRGNTCDLQVFEDTRGISIGNKVEFTSTLLSIKVGPGMLNNVYDGLGNPLEKLAKKTGYFLQRGVYLDPISDTAMWKFTKLAKKNDILKRGEVVGFVKENNFKHYIVIPFILLDNIKIIDIVENGEYTINTEIAKIQNLRTKEILPLTMTQTCPIKNPINCYSERLAPKIPLATKMRIVDIMFPIAEGGTACIPGPFGSGKTVFQQSVSKYGEADIVIVAACGERAGEVVETLREFPHIIDPKTNKSLMERTIIICNTSSMPVAAREASVYTAITIAEYYRHMGLKVLVLADSTSRWAQALREMSGRLEEIPGEEAFPAYLSSSIASFYERAGLIKMTDTNIGDRYGSITLIGTVSPAGGNFEEPVTQSTLSVVGCFWGLTYARSYAKRFPAISPHESWSKYISVMEEKLNKLYYASFVKDTRWLLKYYLKGQKIGDQMKVVGEEDLSLDDYIIYQKSEFFDAAVLQQNSFDLVDAGPSLERTKELVLFSLLIIKHDFLFSQKDHARTTITKITSLFRDMNITESNTIEFSNIKHKIKKLLK